MKCRSFLLLAAPAAVVLGLGAGVSYAYFTSSGNGTGSGSTGTMLAVTVSSATASPSTALLPGGTGDATLKVANSNSYAVTLVSVTGTGGITADGLHPGCMITGVTFTSQADLAISIPPGSTITVDLPGAVSMSAASSSGCQGATFSIPVTITAEKP